MHGASVLISDPFFDSSEILSKSQIMAHSPPHTRTNIESHLWTYTYTADTSVYRVTSSPEAVLISRVVTELTHFYNRQYKATRALTNCEADPPRRHYFQPQQGTIHSRGFVRPSL